ncbi:MAG: hypothetical protein PsegKO_27690 [Pseudohongiellaceae bacterium]
MMFGLVTGKLSDYRPTVGGGETYSRQEVQKARRNVHIKQSRAGIDPQGWQAVLPLTGGFGATI